MDGAPMLFATFAAAATAAVAPSLEFTDTTAPMMAGSDAPTFFTTLLLVWLAVPNINTIRALEQWVQVGLLW